MFRQVQVPTLILNKELLEPLYAVVNHEMI
jgi:hypothetical protein